MEKKDLITVRDYSYDLEDGDLGYYQSRFVRAKDYVNGIVEQLKGKQEKISSFMTVAQFANELRSSQYSEEEKKIMGKIDSYMSEPRDVKKVSY